MAVLETENQPSGARSRTLDISENGVGGLFHESWEVGTRVRLEVSLPVEQTPLKIGAIVRHHAGSGTDLNSSTYHLNSAECFGMRARSYGRGPGN